MDKCPDPTITRSASDVDEAWLLDVDSNLCFLADHQPSLATHDAGD